jgi:hypothetical protein
LFVGWSILTKYQIDKDEVAYTEAYNKQLDKLDPIKVLSDLRGKIMLFDDKLHRRSVVEWIERTTGMRCE